MKTTIVATTFAATALAIPALDALVQCPKNTAQPDGNLPASVKDYVSPSLLLQISAKEPNKKFAGSVTAEVTPGDKCTIFNLDIPVKESQGKVCNFVFDFPEKPTSALTKARVQGLVAGLGGDLVADHRRPGPGGKEGEHTALGGEHKPEGGEHPHYGNNLPRLSSPLASSLDYKFDGPGNFKFIGYDIGVGAVAGETTYAHQPKSGPSPPNPPPKMLPGHSYVINAADCAFPANLTSVKVSGALCSDDTTMRYDQGYLGTCPIGFYVVLTDAKK
ncbi:uncharacterized protein PG986_001208 [Apiospora aurea]|uniref:Ubiquitin 3 binding protein But2 C-terminal domain-containing protein n=1 Tax=Apiospora aurea TaxID=335848 RepID=A0ABR1QX68_9PEZI